MKKIIAIAAMLLLVVSANAQFKWGIKAGANITEMSTSGAVLDASNRTGFYVGPTCKFTLPIVGLGLDLSAVYDQREAKVSSTEGEGSETVSRKSIAIPLNVRYQVIGLGDLASIFAYTGPQIAFNIGDKSLSFKGAEDAAADWTLKSSNFSWNVGLGAFIANHFQINANYNIAIGKTGDQSSIQGAAGEAISTAVSGIFNASNNNSWQIGVAYFF